MANVMKRDIIPFQNLACFLAHNKIKPILETMQISHLKPNFTSILKQRIQNKERFSITIHMGPLVGTSKSHLWVHVLVHVQWKCKRNSKIAFKGGHLIFKVSSLGTLHLFVSTASTILEANKYLFNQYYFSFFFIYFIVSALVLCVLSSSDSKTLILKHHR